MIDNRFIKNEITSLIFNTIRFIKLKYTNPTLKIDPTSRIYNCNIDKYVSLKKNVQLINCDVERYTYFSQDSRFANTSIGKFCSIGPGVRCGMGFHPTDKFVSTHPAFFSPDKQGQISFVDKKYFIDKRNIKIGNDVWIGANAIILDGVHIGNGAIIAAGAVVTKKVEDFSVVGGYQRS